MKKRYCTPGAAGLRREFLIPVAWQRHWQTSIRPQYYSCRPEVVIGINQPLCWALSSCSLVHSSTFLVVCGGVPPRRVLLASSWPMVAYHSLFSFWRNRKLDFVNFLCPSCPRRQNWNTGQGLSQKKLMTEEMSMEDLWPRQSVHGWVLFLGIKSVYNDDKQQKWKKLPRQVPRFACY